MATEVTYAKRKRDLKLKAHTKKKIVQRKMKTNKENGINTVNNKQPEIQVSSVWVLLFFFPFFFTVSFFAIVFES